ncbi:MAG: SH3 domain-containing protein, partial [Bryobacteraceae bacterium]
MAASAVLLVLPLCFVSCTRKSSDVLGEAYIAPASVKLRRDLTEKNSTVATLKHGEEVSIIDVRRVFLQVRTADGAEGWLSSYDLLTSAEMRQIRRERLQARKLPSQGSATVFGTLNIHIEPSRGSPAFAQIRQSQIVQVLAQRIAPRTNQRRKRGVFVIPQPKP